MQQGSQACTLGVQVGLLGRGAVGGVLRCGGKCSSGTRELAPRRTAGNGWLW